MIVLPPQYTIRPATPSDNAFEAALYRSTRGDLLQLDAAPELIEQIIAMQWQIHQAGTRHAYPDASSWTVLRDAEPVAHYIIAPDHNNLHLVSFIVLPSARGQGLGRGIMRQLQQHAAAEQQALTLHVASSNTIARQLYLSLGFHGRPVNAAIDLMRWHPSHE